MTRKNFNYKDYENDNSDDIEDIEEEPISPRSISLKVKHRSLDDDYNEDEYYYEQEDYYNEEPADEDVEEEVEDFSGASIGVTLPTPRYDKNNPLDFNIIMEDYHSNDPVRVEKAMNKVVDELGGLIYSIIKKKYARYSRKYFEDLVQQGNLGIFKGMREYDPQKGKPSTFFCYYIIHEIQDFINVNVNRTSTHYDASTRKIKKIIEGYRSDNREYSVTDLAIDTGLPFETIEESLKILNKTEISFENATDCPGSLDAILPSDEKSPEEELLNNENTVMVNAAIGKTLTPIERTIVELHYGLNDNERMTIKKISKKLDMPTDKIKRNLTMALSKLKHSNLRLLHPDLLIPVDDVKNDDNLIPIISDEYADIALENMKDIEIDF